MSRPLFWLLIFAVSAALWAIVTLVAISILSAVKIVPKGRTR